MKLPCREAQACLFRLDRMGAELHFFLEAATGFEPVNRDIPNNPSGHQKS